MYKHCEFELKPEESLLSGQWIDVGSRMEKDCTSLRIEWLTDSQLEHLAEGSNACENLYRDPRDGRLWEKTCPQGVIGLGGPPQLSVISPNEAIARYGDEWTALG